MYAGVQDVPIVTKLRQGGLDVNDGPAKSRCGRLSTNSMAIGGGSMRNSRGAFPPCAAFVAEDSRSRGNPTLPMVSCQLIWNVISHAGRGVPADGVPGVGPHIDAGPVAMPQGG
jgi:hypothetical protein